MSSFNQWIRSTKVVKDPGFGQGGPRKNFSDFADVVEAESDEY